MRIVISGTVGVGKSTVTKKLSKELTLKKRKILMFEEFQNNNPFLDYYYKDRYEWSFLIQLDFLFERFRTFYSDVKEEKNHISIYDRHFLDDYIFANLNSIRETLTSFQYNIYKRVNCELSSKIPENKKIDYFFILKTDLEEIKNRIKKRGRSFEQNEDLDEYWNDLYYQYYKNEDVKKHLNNNVKKLYYIDAKNSPEHIVKEILKIIED